MTDRRTQPLEALVGEVEAGRLWQLAPAHQMAVLAHYRRQAAPALHQCIAEMDAQRERLDFSAEEAETLDLWQPTLFRVPAWFCRRFVQSSPPGLIACLKSDERAVLSAVETGGCHASRCHAGLSEWWCPVIIDGTAVACVCVGALLAEPLPPEHWRALAERLELRADVEAMIAAARDIPVVSETRAQDFASGACWRARMVERLVVSLREQRRHAEELRSLNEQLEARVVQRTDALDSAAADLKRTQAQLMAAAKSGAVAHIAEGCAHNFNNLLAVIIGRAELLEAELNDPAQRKELQTIVTAGRQGAQIVERLQRFAQPSPPGAIAMADVAQVIADCVEVTRPKWQYEMERLGHSVTLQTAVDRLRPAAVPPSELAEVLTSLILNATEAMPEGGQIEIRAHADERTIALEVSDTGSGIAPALRERIFEPFFTTKGTGRPGLGLTVVQQTVDSRGGRVEIDSSPEEGSTFRVFLPILEFSPEEETTAATAHADHGPTLVVDDDALMRETLEGLLTALGRAAVVVDSGRAAIDVVARDKFGLALVDLGLPGVSGREVVGALREHQPDVPIVVLTGWGERHTKDLDVDAVLLKPFSLSELSQVITRLSR